MTKRVAVIGAGASGLPAIKCCLDEDLLPVCFERSDEIGGLWNYTDDVRECQGCVMKSTVINVSKEMMAFSDFPIPKEFPMFMHNTLVYKYLHMYADHFGLRKYIHHRKEVVRCEPVRDFERTGQWSVTVKDMKTGQIYSEIFDGILAATGHHTDPHMPTFSGQETFKGRIMHARYYRDSLEFSGKRVLVIGFGNSGGDIARELSHLSSKVMLSTRSGSWIIPRVSNNGMPFDMLGTTRVVQFIEKSLPYWVLNKLTEKSVNTRFDHAQYGIKPTYPPRAQDPLISDEFHLKLATGMVQIKPNVSYFTETDIVFLDGSKFEDVDVVIFATGYYIGFPYLDKSVTDVTNNSVSLYKYIFPPNLSQQTLGIIGCVQPLGSITPIAELQSRVVTRVIKGDLKLPSTEDMLRDIEMTRQMTTKRFANSLRHTVMVDFIDYLDVLANMIGCKPNLWTLWLKDPVLAKECAFGPCAAYQYRLIGPNSWKGARHAILTQWERTLYPLSKRNTKDQKEESRKNNRFRPLYFFSAMIGLLTASCLCVFYS